jgi:ABC-type multidrug transport system ATPase subunit
LPFNLFRKKQKDNIEQVHPHGRYRALHNISMRICPGEHVGIVGMNGAGKTTLFRTLAGVLNPADGYALIDGREASSPDRQPVGYMAAFPLVYRQITGYENLRFVANLYHVKNSEDRIRKMVEMVGLTDAIDKYVEQYSTGMAARLDFARVLLPDPPLLVLDEPFGSFDLHFAEEAKKIIRNTAATVILATHNLEDIETITERLILLHRGELIRDVTFTDLSEVAPTHNGKKTLSIVEFVQGLLRRAMVTERNFCEPVHRKHVLSK